MFLFDPLYLLFISPALLLGFLAQMWVKSTYASASQIPVGISGATAARQVLNSLGLQHVDIEEVPGHLSDHYDPREKVLRLSREVYHNHNMAAIGIALHEAGHAIQDAKGYIPLVIRNLAVPAANFGSSGGMILLVLGLLMNFQPLLLAGIALFSCVVFFQLVNLPVEFNASSRAKEAVIMSGFVKPQEIGPINKMLWAAALTYVAATLQSVLTLLYYILRFSRRSND
ncbi:MAG: zinc metallopeptidase [Pirellulaceae bacterium]|nr:zinc metallopeptidase [Pirellulaceae bacterium]